jgi:hypothetical protein
VQFPVCKGPAGQSVHGGRQFRIVKSSHFSPSYA